DTQFQASSLSANQLVYTTSNGQPYSSPFSAQRIGLNGPLLLQDSHLIDNQAHFERENIPDRIVHASGAGAHGIFTVTTGFANKYTDMDVFSKIGKQTPITVRLSNAANSKGSSDTGRNIRGFALKFRTPKGIWDLLIRDPGKFPAFTHSQGRNPHTNRPDPDSSFDFLGSNPEALAQFLRTISNEGTSKGWLHTNAFTVNPYKWVKRDGTWVYVKIVLKTNQGLENFNAIQQSQISNPDYATKELYDSIESGKRPSWTVYAQVLSPVDAEKFRYNVLDVTKEWTEDLVPIYEVGLLELTRNPENYFAEVEQLAFSPANLIDGWEPSEDPILQMRLFAYADAQRYRLGANYQQIPINCPMNQIANFQRDGVFSNFDNQGRRPSYASSFESLNYPIRSFNTDNHTLWSSGAIRYLSEVNDIDFEQPRDYYNRMSTVQKEDLVNNFAFGLSLVSRRDIVKRVIGVIRRASPELSSRI
ncbi:catalase, partial [Phakopsora pachyrhizi]